MPLNCSAAVYSAHAGIFRINNGDFPEIICSSIYLMYLCIYAYLFVHILSPEQVDLIFRPCGRLSLSVVLVCPKRRGLAVSLFRVHGLRGFGALEGSIGEVKEDCLEGRRDLVSRLITPITHIVTLIIPISNLLTKSP